MEDMHARESRRAAAERSASRSKEAAEDFFRESQVATAGLRASAFADSSPAVSSRVQPSPFRKTTAKDLQKAMKAHGWTCVDKDAA